MEYIRLFDEHSEYERYVSEGKLAIPNISYCETQDEVHYDYDAEIEYLESTGTQYIQFPLAVNKKQKFSVEGEMITRYDKSMQVYDRIFGSNPDDQFNGYYYSNTSNYITFASSVGNVTWSGGFGNGKRVGEMGHFYLGTDGRTVTNGTFSPLSRPLTNNITSFRLFWGYNNRRCPIAFGNIIIKVDDVAVYDFIPVRKSTIGYMYDRISKQLFGNSGTGNFVLGSDKQ